METVSTLCATGSILGAAGVGYVFGQDHTSFAVESANKPASSSKFSITHTPRNENKTSVLAATSISTSSERSSHATEQGLPLSSPLPVSQKRTYALTGSPEDIESPPNKRLHLAAKKSPSSPSSGKPSSEALAHYTPYRLKKLASFSFSTTSSPTGSLGFDSKSLALSAESTTPLFKSGSSPAPLPPNKLVKRSFSQHLVDKPGAGDWVTTLQTIDRPATRHKRLATLYRNSSTPKPSADSTSHTPTLPLHQPLFRPKVPKDKFSSLSKYSLGTSIRRIYPEKVNRPFLLLSRSLSPLSVEIDAELENESDHIIFTSPPITPARIPLPSSPRMFLAETQDPVLEQRPRRSFSISDLLSRHPSSPKDPSKKFRLSKSRRVFSSPAFKMRDQHDAEPQGQVETPRKRLKRADKRNSPLDSVKTADIEHDVLEGQAQTPKNRGLGLQEDVNMEGSIVAQKHQTDIFVGHQESSSSSPLHSSLQRPLQWSVTPSDNASSQVESDAEGKVFSSADEEDGDKRSDSVYDSLRTGATRSSSGFKGPPLETLFDKEAVLDASSRRSNTTISKSPDVSPAQALADDEGGNFTPARTVVPDYRDGGRSRNYPLSAPTFTSSPPPIMNLSTTGNLELDSDLEDDDSFWFDKEHEEASADENPISEVDEFDEAQEQPASQQDSQIRSLRFSTAQTSVGNDNRKHNLFDWSEPQPLQNRPSESQLTRPKTVHGKKAPSGREKRAAGRRTPSGLHARSKSVPVLADLVSGHRQMTSKFGTWGVGSKGVTEDWNDDFEFDVADSDFASARPEAGSTDTSTTHTMIVPESIKEQQTNVLANIGLLKEWGLLIEELKELRERAVSLGLQSEQFGDLFDEVDAMIELADQEAEENEAQPQWTPSKSPGVDLEDFGSVTSSPLIGDAVRSDGAEEGSASASYTPTGTRRSPATRPRKNSQVVAQSVIEALQKRRQVPPATSLPSTPKRKVPFDTTTLRHIVPHVTGLSKKFKHALRQAEGLNTSPKQSPRSPKSPLRRAFIDPREDKTSEDEDRKDKDMKTIINDMGNTTLHE